MVGPIGGSEVILVFVLALLLFGPRKLPEIGRALGRTVTQLRRAATDFKLDLEREIKVEEFRETEQSLKAVGEEISDTVSEVRGTEPAGGPAGTGVGRESDSNGTGADPEPSSSGP